MIAAALALLAATPVVHAVRPAEADPAVKSFVEPSIAITRPDLPADAPLAIFLTGTGGKPGGAPALLETISAQGYRVLDLAYDDTPAVVQVCTRDPDPACASDFREMRILGTGKSKTVANPTAEAIVPRLVAALSKLDATYPGEGWGHYLDGDQPRWGDILVSGLSQGAGMAAWIAKRYEVRRVVLFSSPWETTGADHRPAPWIGAPSATPIARWQAAYNTREKTVSLITAAYALLGLSSAQIHVLSLDLPEGRNFTGPNPYHPIGIRDVRYAGEWKAMYGNAADAPQ